MAEVQNGEDDVREPFWEYESQRESEEEVGPLTAEQIRQAVVSGTDWTTETIVGQIRKGNIQLSPAFQRRDAWRAVRKSRFVESVLLGLPIPQVVLAEIGRGSYIVLDGKQRLLSLCQFTAMEGDQQFERLRLKGLEIRTDLNGLSLADMEGNLALRGDVTAFENQSIRTVVIKNWPNESFLYHVFLRLNTNSVTLSPQELRQALHPGPFVSFVEQMSGSSASIKDILGQTEPDFRMRDAELLVRYYAFRNFMPTYRGNLKAFFDASCQELNDGWDHRRAEIEAQLTDLDEIHIAVKAVFGDDAYHKWTRDGFERRFNRAVFDIMVFSFMQPETRSVLVGKGGSVVSLFQRLCLEDSEFLAAIERTTKSITATAARHGIWARSLNQAFGLSLPVLVPAGDHLTFE